MSLPSCSRSAAQVDGYDWFGPVLANNQNHFSTIFPSFGYNSCPGIFKGFLHPSADVQIILDAHRALFQNFYVIGVQLRAKTRLRAEVEEHVWRLMLFLKSQAEAAQRKPVVFYLCIDSKEPWDRLISLFGKDIIFSASITAGRIGRMSKEVRESAFCRIMRASAAARCERARRSHGARFVCRTYSTAQLTCCCWASATTSSYPPRALSAASLRAARARARGEYPRTLKTGPTHRITQSAS